MASRRWGRAEREAMVFMNRGNRETLPTRLARYERFVQHLPEPLRVRFNRELRPLVEEANRLELELERNPAQTIRESLRDRLNNTQEQIVRVQRRLLLGQHEAAAEALKGVLRSLPQGGQSFTVADLLPRNYRAHVGDETRPDGTFNHEDAPLPPRARALINELREAFGYTAAADEPPGHRGTESNPKPRELRLLELGIEHIFSHDDPGSGRLESILQFVRALRRTGEDQPQAPSKATVHDPEALARAAEQESGRPVTTDAGLGDGMAPGDREAVTQALGRTMQHGPREALQAFTEFFGNRSITGGHRARVARALRNIDRMFEEELARVDPRITDMELRMREAATNLVARLKRERGVTDEMLRQFRNCPGGWFAWLARNL